MGNYSDYVGKTISFTLKNVSNTDNKSISYYIVKSSGDWAKNTIIKSRSTSLGATGTITATIEADDAATNLGIRIYLGTDGVGDEFILDNIQVEEGSVATNYEPYVEPKQYNIYLDEPLRRIGDYADYIDFENQKVVRQIQKNIITGTEANWEIMDYNTIPIYRYRLSVENIVKGTNYTEQLCNYLQGEDITTKDTKIGMSVYYSSSLGGTFFRMRTGTQYENTSALKEYLSNLYTSGKPIEYYFATTEILEETMELPNIYIPKGNFVLSVDSNGIDVPIEASYYKQF